eukprot:PhF_6_TR16968/c0_g1_i4/m.25635
MPCAHNVTPIRGFASQVVLVIPHAALTVTVNNFDTATSVCWGSVLQGPSSPSSVQPARRIRIAPTTLTVRNVQHKVVVLPAALPPVAKSARRTMIVVSTVNVPIVFKVCVQRGPSVEVRVPSTAIAIKQGTVGRVSTTHVVPNAINDVPPTLIATGRLQDVGYAKGDCANLVLHAPHVAVRMLTVGDRVPLATKESALPPPPVGPNVQQGTTAVDSVQPAGTTHAQPLNAVSCALIPGIALVLGHVPRAPMENAVPPLVAQCASHQAIAVNPVDPVSHVTKDSVPSQPVVLYANPTVIALSAITAESARTIDVCRPPLGHNVVSTLHALLGTIQYALPPPAVGVTHSPLRVLRGAHVVHRVPFTQTAIKWGHVSSVR